MKILIMGLGHLAQMIVDELNKIGNYSITASHRGKAIKRSNVDLFNFEIGDDFPEGLPNNLDFVIWNFPPRPSYLDSLRVFNAEMDSKIPWIFVSSTSTYFQGKCNEEAPKKGTTANASILIEIENYLSRLKRKTGILYPGGLIDKKRNPARSLAQRDTISASNSPVNVVYTPDVACFISKIITKEIALSNYNLVMSDHPTKEEFYRVLIKKLDLPMPSWNESGSIDKVIDNTKALMSGFSFRNPLEEIVNSNS